MFSKFISLSLTQQFILIITAFFAPIIVSMIAVGLLITLDTIFGIMAAKKKGEEITSKKFGRVITKTFVYQLLIISSHLIETYLFTQVPFVQITLGYLAMTEFLSLAESFFTITGKDLLSYIKDFLDQKFRGMLKSKDEIPKP